ncbi:MAG: AAA family ATPase [Verrucomicrobiales bacterium]|nr:AAA family ATPase [Verrucomicrobiales bacterium]
MPFLRSAECATPGTAEFPFSIPAVSALASSPMKLNRGLTFLVGENGSGKSTILEGIADKHGFTREGGPRTKNLVQKDYWSDLGGYITLQRSPGINPMDGFFLRSESFFNFATVLDELESEFPSKLPYFSYGGKSLHVQSHGESFLSLFLNRFGEHGLYILDEPEAALSPSRQLALMVRIHDLIEAHCQFIIATHSPILLGFPGATIYQLDEDGLEEVSYEETSPYQITQQFLKDRERMLGFLFSEEDFD